MRVKRLIFALTICGIFIFFSPIIAKAGYNYSYYLNPIASAEAMIYKTSISIENIVLEYTTKDEHGNDVVKYHYPEIGELTDIFVHNDKIYVVDSQLSKILIFNSEFKLIDEYPSTRSDSGNYVENLPERYKLNRPSGIFVDDNYIYIADTDNNRIVIFDERWYIRGEITEIDDVTFENTVFKPTKVAVDQSGRMYIIAQGIYEGIIELNSDGEFNRYVGVNHVTLSAIDILRRRFMTQEHRSQMQLLLPTEFVNLELDEDGFIYAVSKPTSQYSGSNTIKRINPKGVNVLSKQGYFEPMGDIVFPWSSSDAPEGPSQLVDISFYKYGIYSVLDRKRGRIFTYDFEGNLLYIAGEIGTQKGMFTSPEAMAYFNDDILVVDSINRNITVLELTDFGRLINEASIQYFEGDYEASSKTWEEVLKYNTNYYLAYRGIGQGAYRQEDYKKAMKYFKLANDKDNYSKAFAEYRNEVLSDYFIVIMIVIFLGIAYLFISSIRNNVRYMREERGEEY